MSFAKAKHFQATEPVKIMDKIWHDITVSRNDVTANKTILVFNVSYSSDL